MDYDNVLLLSRVYENQRKYYDQQKLVGQNIYTTLFNEGSTGILRNYENLQTIVATFLYRECGLLERYDAVLAQLPTADPAVERPPIPPICAFTLRRQ